MLPSSRAAWILNILRVCSIISLIMAIVASWATLVKSFVVTRFYFFDAANEVLLSIICVFVLLSELSVAQRYFEKNWPLFGPRASLVAVGIAEMIIGFSLLGHLNEGFASKKNLGGAFHALLLSSGVIISVVGAVSFIASFAFRETSTGTTARMMRCLKKDTESNYGGPEIKMRSPTMSQASTFKPQYMPEHREDFRSATPYSSHHSRVDSRHSVDNVAEEDHRDRVHDLENGPRIHIDGRSYFLGDPVCNLKPPQRMYSHRTYRSRGDRGDDASSTYSRTINGTSVYDPKDRDRF